MEWIEPIEKGLAGVVGLLKLTLEAISVLCIFLGLVATARLALARPSSVHAFSFSSLRLCFGSWLALALEFQLGSDIMATAIAPSFEALGKLAAIALIRTFLNYFLNKELKSEATLEAPRCKTPPGEGS